MRRPENNSPLRSMRTTSSPGSSPFSAGILKTEKTLGTRLSMRIKFYSCQTAKTWRPGKGIQTKFSMLKSTARMFHSTKKVTLITGSRTKKKKKYFLY